MKYRKQGKFQQFSNPQTRRDIIFQLYDSSHILIMGHFSSFTNDVRQVIKNNGGSFSNYEGDKGWLIPNLNYKVVLDQLRDLKDEIILKTMPHFLFKLNEPLTKELKFHEDQQIHTLHLDLEPSMDDLEPTLLETLYPYQRDSILKGLEQRGRILIADEMGVGKTVQSLALASLYKSVWPLLIIAPSTLRLVWQDEIVNWLKVPKFDIQVITKANQNIRLNAKIVIISYDLCAKLSQQLKERKFKIAIADECHYLKSFNSQRSQACVPVLKFCQQVILLTGTPALAKPKELFNVLAIIRPDIFTNFKEFGFRYCDPKINRFTGGVEYEGSSCSKELHYILSNYIMIRRLKKDVLSQLPEKRRIKIRICGEGQVVKQIQALLSQLEKLDMDAIMNKMQHKDQARRGDDEKNNEMGPQQILGKCYVLTGQAKIKGIKEYLTELIKNEVKFLFFGYHIEVLDAAQELCVEQEVKFIRISGETPMEQRHRDVKLFQECDEVRVAVLGITAANMGLTLTAASTIVFGEMHWTPAIMFQAEDRAHRIGQQFSVDCHYLIGEDTLDPIIFAKLNNKVNIVSNFLDGKEKKMQAQYASASVVESIIASKQIMKAKAQEVQMKVESEQVIEQDNDWQGLEEYSAPEELQSSMIGDKREDSEKVMGKMQIEVKPEIKKKANTLKQGLILNYLKKAETQREVVFFEQNELPMFKQIGELAGKQQQLCQEKRKLQSEGFLEQVEQMIKDNLLKPCPYPQETPLKLNGTLSPNAGVEEAHAQQPLISPLVPKTPLPNQKGKVILKSQKSRSSLSNAARSSEDSQNQRQNNQVEPPEKLGLDYLEKIISEGANSKQTEISQKKLINFRDSYARAEEKVCSTKKQSI